MSSTVVITGANRGIGLSFARHYAASGHDVIGVCRESSPALDAVAARVIDKTDIASPEDVCRLAGALAGASVSLLINNAGILRNEILGSLNYETIIDQFHVNTLGALRVTEALLPMMASPSRIAIITSRMGSIADNGSGGRYGYRMSKAALNAASKSLAIDLAPCGISVGIYHPGLVGTDMIGGAGDITPDEAASRLAGLIDSLDSAETGVFRHSNGEELPW